MVSPNAERKKASPMVAMNRMICSWFTRWRRIRYSTTTANRIMIPIVSRMASGIGTPMPISPARLSAANRTSTPWAKLNMPEAL